MSKVLESRFLLIKSLMIILCSSKLSTKSVQWWDRDISLLLTQMCIFLGAHVQGLEEHWIQLELLRQYSYHNG
jgi:hypothetical protein